ncbi:MAG TPA: AAA family ATPase [Candidatus Omnitrophica bacterium]|nr:AAA family ATPase [Candidatus Omnitrophota bacterium]
MNKKKIKLFFRTHLVKIIAAFVICLGISLPIIALGRLDSYQRDYILAFNSFIIITSIVYGGIFVYFIYGFSHGGFAKLKHKSIGGEHLNVSWDEVIGIDEAKEEAWEVVSLLKDRARLQRVGGQILRGMLMLGPPGCGKTYLAKAIATEANIPFISISGSEFVEMYVGVGASRVRKLFKRARQLAESDNGCIIFIDEIDAVAARRTESSSGGATEYNQTLNQLLVEMDGLKEKDYNLLVIAATNREQVLDEAIKRPGRFDRKIYFRLPNLEGREKLFEYYLKKIKYNPDINIGRLARRSVQKSPADIASIIQEAALIAARHKKDLVGFEEIAEAMERIDMGIKHRVTFTPHEKEMTAYHEAGHLIVTYMHHPTDDVFKATIIPRGPSLGAVYHPPREELHTFSRERIIANIKVGIGGYVAEKLKYGTTSSGVASDFEGAMFWAHMMVWKIGMGESELIGDYTAIPKDQLSEHTKQQLNNDTNKIIKDCLSEVETLLTDERPILDRFAKELLEKEELDYDEIEAIFKEHGKSRT